jgi:hypothetical protein
MKPIPSNVVENSKYEGTKQGAVNPKFDTSIFNSSDAIDTRLTEITKDHSSFPVQAFPVIIQQIIKGASENLNFPIAYIAASILFAASLAIGNTYLIKVKGTWLESALIYLALVGRPGANKSHPLTFSIAPIIKRDNELYAEYRIKEEKYEADIIAYKRDPEGREVPKRPYLEKALLSDTTPEAVIMILSNNKRGIGIYADELATWFKNFNRYNSGSEQEFYLTNWSGGVINVDRKGYHVRIEKPFISVAGTIQPGVLDELKKDNRGANGFIERILFVYLAEVKRVAWTDNDLSDDLRRSYTQIINRLLALSFTTDGSGMAESNVLTFEPKAMQVIKDWQCANASKDNEVDSDIVNGISTKIETYAIRFCLILQLLKWAAGESDNKETVEEKTAKDAILLAEYFKKQALNVAQYISNSNPIDRLPEIKQKIYRSLPNEFTTAEGLSIATGLGMPQRTFEYWLKDSSVFKHVRQGKYEKVHKEGTVEVARDAQERRKRA